MGIMSMAALVFGGAVTAIMYKLLGDEAKAWLPHFSRMLVRRAVSKLPECQQEHYSEACMAEFEETPGGDLARLYYAIWLQHEANHMVAALTGEWPYATLDAVIDQIIAVSVLTLLFPYLFLAWLLVRPKRHVTYTFKHNGGFVHIQRTRVAGAAVTPIRYRAVIKFLYKTGLVVPYEFLQVLVAVSKGKAKLNFRQVPLALPKTICLYVYRVLSE